MDLTVGQWVSVGIIVCLWLLEWLLPERSDKHGEESGIG